MVSSACGTSRLIPNVLCTNILKIEGGHCFYVLPAIARSPICCLFPTSNRADARMFSLPCAYSCPGIYNAITAMAVSSSFNCFKLYKTYIHPIYLSHIHTRASFRTTAAAATAKPAYRGCIAPLPDPNTLYKMWITIIFNYIHICFWKMMYVGWNRRLWRKRESKCLALLQLCCILVDIACNLQLDGPEKDHVRRYLGVRRICHCALLLFAWRLFRRHSGIGGGAERHLRT